MFPENIDRNIQIYDLWKKGYTIDEMSFDTAIPRSTVGYYVRKFNKRARRGEPIIFQHKREKRNEEEIAFITFMKHCRVKLLSEWMREGPDALDKIYKYLGIIKLLKEVEREIFTTKEEEKALYKHWPHMLQQLMDKVDMLSRIETEKRASLSYTQKKKKLPIKRRMRSPSLPFRATRRY